MHKRAWFSRTCRGDYYWKVYDVCISTWNVMPTESLSPFFSMFWSFYIFAGTWYRNKNIYLWSKPTTNKQAHLLMQCFTIWIRLLLNPTGYYKIRKYKAGLFAEFWRIPLISKTNFVKALIKFCYYLNIDT